MANTFQRITTKDHRLSQFRYYEFCVYVFLVALLVSNLVAQKLVSFGEFHILGRSIPFTFSGAQLLFPITYIFGDIFTEVYGYSGSRRAIWVGFFSSALIAVMGLIVVALPPAPSFSAEAQRAFEIVFYQAPRAIAASLIAFWCGEFANSYVMAKMKIWSGGKHLWMRTVGSTAVGQFVDTVVVMTLIFGGKLSIGEIFTLVYSGYIFKVTYEALATPVTYAVVNWLKRNEGVDVFDTDTNFNPFVGEKR